MTAASASDSLLLRAVQKDNSKRTVITMLVIAVILAALGGLGYGLTVLNKEEKLKIFTYNTMAWAVMTGLFLAYRMYQRNGNKNKQELSMVGDPNAPMLVRPIRHYYIAIGLILVAHLGIASGGYWFHKVMPDYWALTTTLVLNLVLMSCIYSIVNPNYRPPRFSLQRKGDYDVKDCMKCWPYHFANVQDAQKQA